MSEVTAVSLAVIAATCIIAVSAFIVFLVSLRRVLARVEAMLTLVYRVLPGLVTDARGILVRVDKDIVGEVARTVTLAATVVESGVGAVDQVRSAARRVAQGVFVPQMAAMTGVLAAIREGLTWFRPTGDGKRR